MTTWPQLLSALVRKEDQPRSETRWAMQQILGGDATAAQLTAFVIALRSKGETVDEIAGLAETMLEFATRIDLPEPAVDLVGSGGDRANTVNISTMAALVVAATGTRVVKHGSRAASSTSGAADVLEALGVVLDLTPQQQQRVVAEVGIGFLFAPAYHPALRHAAIPRREIGIPTTFNFLGPLTNPAQPTAQSIGVADRRMAGLMAAVLASRGHRGLVAHGDDGLDEFTTTTGSSVWVYDHGSVTETTLDPADLGIARATADDLTGGDAAHNAQVVRDLVAGAGGPVRDIVLLNAAAGLVAFDGPKADVLTDQFRAALVRVADAVDSGAAAAKLTAWVSAAGRAKQS